jgi:hypothetical protein
LTTPTASPTACLDDLDGIAEGSIRPVDLHRRPDAQRDPERLRRAGLPGPDVRPKAAASISCAPLLMGIFEK